MQKSNKKEIVIKPCTHSSLALAFGVSRKVLYARLRPFQNQIGKRNGYKYSLEQLFTIFECIGWPPYPIN